eukprot:3489617-Amphidinium_carterae.1
MGGCSTVQGATLLFPGYSLTLVTSPVYRNCVIDALLCACGGPRVPIKQPAAQSFSCKSVLRAAALWSHLFFQTLHHIFQLIETSST